MVKRDQTELSQATVDRITTVVHSLTEDRVDRGIDLSRPMRCDSCQEEKPPAGSSSYGSYKLCNDCLLDYTLALAAGKIDSVGEFMTAKSDDPAEMAPTELSPSRERPPVQLKSLQGRDKLMPSNEPC